MIEFKRRTPANVANPDPGGDVLFLDDMGVYYTKDEMGNLTVLGNGIAGIAKIGTAELVDTYRITFDDNSTFDYSVTNGEDGRSIVSIERTAGNGAAGTTDTYTITYNKAPLTTTFTVVNGANGQGTPANAPPPAVAATSSVGTTTAEYALEDHTHAGVTSFNGRQGTVTPQQADYDAFFTTPSEAAAAAPVQNFNGRTGNITPQQADYDAFFTTPAEAAAAAPVQSVNGQTGNVTIDVPPVALERAFQARTATVTLPTTNAQVALASVTLAAGTWHISAHATFTRTATTAGNFSIMIGPNATPAQAFASATIQHASVANIFVCAACSAIVTLGATTTVTLYGAHSAGATSNIVRNLNQQNAPGATAISAIKVA